MTAPASAADRDLATSGDLRFDGATSGDSAGFSVASIGDLNHDGLDDIAVGAPKAEIDEQHADAGAVFVVFGRLHPELGPAGSASLADAVRIDGAAANDAAGTSVSGAGDVNADGYTDLLIGAPGTDALGRTDAGAAYVVFGSEDFGPLDLGQLGSRGYRLDGEYVTGAAGSAVSGATEAGSGDVNGDGLDDLVIGAPGLVGTVGRVYVVYGKASTGSQDLNPDTGHFKVVSDRAGARAGSSVAMLGDITGDGRAEVAVGSDGPYAYILNARDDFSRIPLSSIEQGSLSHGFGVLASAGAGSDPKPVSRIRDLSGDGRPELLVGHPRASSAYLVFGKHTSPPIDPTVQGPWGYRIFTDDGEGGLFDFGAAVDGAGDLNGDGLPETVIGAPKRDVLLGASALDRIDAGITYVVYGKADTEPVQVTQPPDPNKGFAMLGAAGGEESGRALAGLEDFDGDTIPDLLVAAPAAGRNDRPGSGSVYVVSGGSRDLDPLAGLADPPPGALGSVTDPKQEDEGVDDDPEAPVPALNLACLPDLYLNPDNYCGETDGTSAEALGASQEQPLSPPGAGLGSDDADAAYAQSVRAQWGLADSEGEFLDTDAAPGIQPDQDFEALRGQNVMRVRLTVPWDILSRASGPKSYRFQGTDKGAWNNGPRTCTSRCALRVPQDKSKLDNLLRVYAAAYPKDGPQRAELLISFEHTSGTQYYGYAPAPKDYETQVGVFLRSKRFEKIKWFTAWNEPNHKSQPTGVKHCREVGQPKARCAKRAAQYWSILNQLCAKNGRCNGVLAGDFSDNADFGPEYLGAYRDALNRGRDKVRHWAYHAHDWGSDLPHARKNLKVFLRGLFHIKQGEGDPNDNGSDPTAVVWVTEAGGRLSLHRKVPGLTPQQVEQRANDDLKRLLYDLPDFTLPNLSNPEPIRRFFVYEWRRNPAPENTFDASLIDDSVDPRRPRCLYESFKRRIEGVKRENLPPCNPP